jgi:hypothetical protein
MRLQPEGLFTHNCTKMQIETSSEPFNFFLPS